MTAEPSESNAFETFARLILSQNQRNPPNDTQRQAFSNTSILTKNNICSTPQNNMTQSQDQSKVILQQFSMITEELQNFTNKVSSDITKYTSIQYSTGKHR